MDQTCGKLCTAWRIRDIFYVLTIYFCLLCIFLFIEAKIFGKDILCDNTNKPPIIFFIEEVVDNSILIFLVVFYVTKRYRSNISEIGFIFEKVRKNICLGILTGVLLRIFCIVINFIIESLGGIIPEHPDLELLRNADNITYAVVLTSIIFLVPIAEEMYCRGFTYTIFKIRQHIDDVWI